MKRRVVVTGLGAITPIGNDVPTNWENAKNGVNGIDTITNFDITDFDVTLAGEVKDFDFVEYFGKKQMKRMDRFVQFAVVATKEAMDDSKINMDEEGIDNEFTNF